MTTLDVEVIDVLAALREAHGQCHQLTGRLARASVALSGGFDLETGERVKGVATEWQEVVDNELIALEEEKLAAGLKMPPVDLRTAHVTRRARLKNEELYAQFLALDAQVRMLQKTISNRKAEISAAQSILKGEAA